MVLPSNVKDPVGRIEDKRLLTGRGVFVDDLNFPNQAYMGLVLSPFAHARIKHIDFTKASSSPDFIDSLTGEDLINGGVLPISQNPWPFQKRAKRHHLAVGKVRFAGEPVAAILVKSKSSLEDLIDLVEVEYEELPVVATKMNQGRGKPSSTMIGAITFLKPLKRRKATQKRQFQTRLSASS